jgi:hypothetical protein
LLRHPALHSKCYAIQYTELCAGRRRHYSMDDASFDLGCHNERLADAAPLSRYRSILAISTLLWHYHQQPSNRHRPENFPAVAADATTSIAAVLPHAGCKPLTDLRASTVNDLKTLPTSPQRDHHLHSRADQINRSTTTLTSATTILSTSSCFTAVEQPDPAQRQ